MTMPAHILLVEDNEMNRDMLTRRLVKAGYKVSSAIDGPSGIEAARALTPDVILMDVALGEMDGWQTTTLIKAMPDLRQIPIIALTAYALESDRQKSVEVGCADFDTKPVNIARLLNKIESQISRLAA